MLHLIERRSPLPNSPSGVVEAGESPVDDNIAELARIREIAEIVDGLAATWRPIGLSVHDRRWQRVVYEDPLVVYPLARRGEDFTADGPAVLVSGRDLSRGGVSFEHTTPLPQRFVAVTFPSERMDGLAVVTQLTWCRFTRAGHYLGGGRFLRRIAIADLGPTT